MKDYMRVSKMYLNIAHENPAAGGKRTHDSTQRFLGTERLVAQIPQDSNNVCDHGPARSRVRPCAHGRRINHIYGQMRSIFLHQPPVNYRRIFLFSGQKLILPAGMFGKTMSL